MRSTSPIVIAAAALLVPWYAVHAQDSPAGAGQPDALQARYDSAYFAWQDGDYVHALEALERLLEADGGARFLEPAALLTGELYRTVEIAPDGTNPRWGPAGRWAAYETETDDGRRTTHLVRLDGGRVVERASVSGRGLVFDPAGERAAYLAPPTGDAHWAARDSLDRSIEVDDFESYRARQRTMARFDAEHARIVVRELRTGEEREPPADGLDAAYELAYAAAGGALYVIGAGPSDADGTTNVYAVRPGAGAAAERITRGAGMRTDLVPVAGGRHLLLSLEDGEFAVVDPTDGRETSFVGSSPAVAADGSALVFVASDDALDAIAPSGRENAPEADDAAGANGIVVVSLDGGLEPTVVARTDDPVAEPAVSPDGRRVVYRRMPREDWELFAVGADGDGGVRVTWDIQHDLFPRFVDDARVLAVVGEGRHRRSFLHDLDALDAARTVELARAAYDEPATPGRRDVSSSAEDVRAARRNPAGSGPADASRRIGPAASRAAPADIGNAAQPTPPDAASRFAPPVHPTASVRVRTRLFHNNTVRTFSPEYEWAASPDGTGVLVVAERDGDTISPESGVYAVDLTSTVTRGELLDRIGTMLRDERALRARGEAAYAPVAEPVRAAVADVAVSRIYEYERELYGYGSKYMSRPGNHRAIAYLRRTLESFGYDVELQWFEPRGVRTANVIATLRGTTNPELVYVISSHFDSVGRGTGADDNTSGTVALLEAARVLASRPQPATIQFAFFTGEEAGLLGSREFVRRAVEDGTHIAGALNNDMVGYANDHRLDNTIRYSNAGIRDLQHAAAFLFTDLITYDAKYYKSTDAHAYYDAYGDIVGGIGSYPVLSSPHYHREHDVLEIIDHRLVTEVSRTTVASIMRLASSPARLTGLEVAARDGDAVELRWDAAPERDIDRYIIARGAEDAPPRGTVEATEPRVRLPAVQPGTVVRVKAVNARGLDGWDWARIEIE